MGLDQYAYARPPRKRNSDDDVAIAEWRKHNRLQGWMQELDDGGADGTLNWDTTYTVSGSLATQNTQFTSGGLCGDSNATFTVEGKITVD